ncbi:SRPBCC domain-containing protein [Brevibacillus fluminis]|uniref:SRPBCC domain-containing protein n=1 Tax=Brevibacillus fluminis TaxID=511487 RepID=A0A3M8DW24_9BACL|nr:SRPBCC domain-containing protein [Brevibacillus fluminis]RNB92316.1 SRPBCC domain-containing protein [Brevibacillus fluminis]
MLVPDIKHHVTLHAPIQQVWETVATSAGLVSWLMPNTFVQELGARFTMQSSPRGNWDGTIECEVVKLEAPNLLAFTWEGGGLTNLLVTIELTEQDGKTDVSLVHSGWTESTKAIRDMLDHGWVHHCFPRLAAQVEAS